MMVKTLLATLATVSALAVSTPVAEAAGRNPVLVQSGITLEKRIVSSDGQLVGTMQTAPRLKDGKVRFFVRSRGAATFGRYHKEVIIDVALDRLKVVGGNVVLPEKELYIFNTAYIPSILDEGAAIRVTL